MNKDASPEQILRFLQKHATTDNTEAPDLQIQLRPVKQTDVRNIRSLYAASQLESTHSALNALLFSAPVATVLALLFAAELYCIYQEFYLIFAPLCLFQLAVLYIVRKVSGSSIENQVLSVLQPVSGHSDLSWDGMLELTQSTGEFLVAVDTSLVATAGPQFERVLGFISMQPSDKTADTQKNQKFASNKNQSDSSSTGHIKYFAVSSAMRRKGIGSQLVEAIEQYAKQQHLSSIYIDLNQHAMDAMKLLHKRGFTEISRRWSRINAEATIRLAKRL